MPHDSKRSLGRFRFDALQQWRISKLWAVATVLAAVVAVLLVLRFRTPPHPEQKHELVERQLTANPPENTVSSAAISRDGKYLAYGDFSKKVYLLAIESGEIRQVPLPAPYTPVDWFPDGNHLLLAGGANGGDLWKISTWDFSLRKLWGGLAYQAAVSPDGLHIAFVKDDHEVWLMGADGEEPHKILASDAQSFVGLAWSPTGQRLAYIRLRGTFAKREATIETCDLAGGARTVVLSDPNLWGFDGIANVAWVPDGRIIYSIFSGVTEANLWARIADPSTGKPVGDATRLAGWKNFEAWDPQASTDGKRLIANRAHTENGIYIGDLAFGNKGFTPHRFTRDDWFNGLSDWTKDGKSVLFHSKRNGRWAIFKQNIDGETPETLIAGSENYFLPRLSAQGTLLYSAEASPDFEQGDTTIRLMSTPEGGGPRSTLMMGRYTYACGSSPSSSCVVAELKDKQLIFSHLDPVKGRGEEIASIAGYKSQFPRWDLSPDGVRIAIVEPLGKGAIRILNLADRRVTILPVRDWKWQDLEQISWAADGKSWFALAQSGSSVALLFVDAYGNPRILHEIPAGSGWVTTIVPSPDGKHLAFTKRVYLHDVMLLENF